MRFWNEAHNSAPPGSKYTVPAAFISTGALKSQCQPLSKALWGFVYEMVHRAGECTGLCTSVWGDPTTLWLDVRGLHRAVPIVTFATRSLQHHDNLRCRPLRGQPAADARRVFLIIRRPCCGRAATAVSSCSGLGYLPIPSGGDDIRLASMSISRQRTQHRPRRLSGSSSGSAGCSGSAERCDRRSAELH